MRSLSLPTARTDWRRMGWAIEHVFGRPRWTVLGLGTGTATVALFVAFDSPVYVQRVVLGGDLSLFGRVRAFVTLFPALAPGPGFVRGLLLYPTGLAVGTNVTMLGYQLRHNRGGVAGGSGGILAVTLGVLGAGCASCGVAVVASALSLTGVAAGLAALPFDGLEFLVLALGVTVVSIHWVAVGLAAGDVAGCPVEPPN